MQVQAKLNNLRLAPRKVRLVANDIRGKSVGKVLTELQFSHKRAAGPLAKLIRSAVANAVQKSPNLDVDTLSIKSIHVDGGSIGWKIRPRAMGRAFWVSKRSSHITLVLGDE